MLPDCKTAPGCYWRFYCSYKRDLSCLSGSPGWDAHAPSQPRPAYVTQMPNRWNQFSAASPFTLSIDYRLMATCYPLPGEDWNTGTLERRRLPVTNISLLFLYRMLQTDKKVHVFMPELVTPVILEHKCIVKLCLGTRIRFQHEHFRLVKTTLVFTLAFPTVSFKSPHDFKQSPLWTLLTVALVCSKPCPDPSYV